ncbi:D-2-hydroxyacid dehydrogenase [Bradyrhizobium sp. LHD-71]|uniref:D-2-hydroxyacid dehydrogenase n=1 Tax=Bradyrhizobium sp. LHD-71 TaxID=3072141 RepID=UPI00280F6DDD|nr:D-2-hydroxyacid dehydrogenase [Bradyrhizobium sp. LHD-71]MDQ8731828.1 D-2-hydroxyacid dehydrogenase [Bradyrhizobium sp. LHD-71]
MQPVKILSLQRLSRGAAKKIEAVDARVQLTDAGGWFDGEIRETWPEFNTRRYMTADAQGHGSREERNRLLSDAEVVLGSWPYPLDLRQRAPALKWFHQLPAGASNLRMGDLWNSDVMVTTSRGVGSTLAIAEHALAGIMHFAKSFHQANFDRVAGEFDVAAYRPLLLDGKTACIVGAGGIGQDVGLLCAALGMRVLGIRRRQHGSAPLPEGFIRMGTAADLDGFLAQSDFVIVCAQWTPETTKLINKQRFAAMKDGATLVNIARGEIIDEDALLDALKADRLRGVALDVYVGEFEHLPPDTLWSDPRVLITPHTSGAADDNRHGGIDLFCENLRAYIDGRALQNVVDWQRGY